MSSPVNAILTGSFVSTGAQFNLSLPSGYTAIELYNMTDLGSAAAATPVMRATGTSLMPAGAGIFATKTNGAATIAIPTTTLTNGFTFVDDSSKVGIGNLVALTPAANTINQAAPAVALTGSTAGLVANTSIVRLANTTGMLQIAGMDFTIGTFVLNTSFQLQNLDTSGVVGGFGANATNGSYRIIPFDVNFYPRNRYITNISLANPCRVTLSVTHGYTVGQQIRFIIPAGWGTTQLNGLTGTITAIGNADVSGFTNTIDVNIDTTGFTAFTFPTSAVAAGGISYAQIVPVGEAATNTVLQPFANLLDDAERNTAFRGVQIGTSVQTNAKTYQWIAYKGLIL